MFIIGFQISFLYSSSGLREDFKEDPQLNELYFPSHSKLSDFNLLLPYNKRNFSNIWNLKLY